LCASFLRDEGSGLFPIRNSNIWLKIRFFDIVLVF